MKYKLWILLLVSTTTIEAKKPEIYRCPQKDGSVVIQDRRCMITDLHQVKSSKQKKPELIQQGQNKNSLKVNRHSPIPKRINNRSSLYSTQKEIADRSDYFDSKWDRFIPANWDRLKVNAQNHEQLLLSRTQLNGKSDFKQGVKLSVYSDTMKASRLDSFAQALELYHQIRDNGSYQLLDSQFKAHPRFKVFNIKYQNQQQQLMLTEFYIDEKHNDLFVVTVQAATNNWSVNQALAEMIINQL